MNSRFCPAMPASMFAWMLVAVLALSGGARAQDTQQPQEPAEAAAEENAQVPVAKNATPPTPPPGPEVMRPTEHGLLMPQKMIELIAKQAAGGIGKELKLRPDQTTKFQDLIVNNTIELQSRHGNELATAIEHFIEFSIKTDGQINSDSARELSEKLKPALPAVTDSMDSFMRGARPLLDDSQFKEFNGMMEEGRGKVKQLEQRLDSWSKGEATKGNLFQQLFADEEATNKSKTKEKEATSQPAKSETMQKAESRYDRAMNEIGPQAWEMFLYSCHSVFGFNQEQLMKGQEILKKYRKKAKEIRTLEWIQRVRDNRVKTHAKKLVEDESIEPWIYHLDREYEELVKPIKDLGRAYHREIVGMATDEQRAKVLAQLQKFGTEHGMSADEMSAQYLHLAATQPEGK